MHFAMAVCPERRLDAYFRAMTFDRRAAREILLYGVFAGALIVLLRLVEYRYLILEETGPVYGGIIAAIFAFIGIRLGQKIVRVKTVERVVVEKVVEVQEIMVPSGAPFERNQAAVDRLAITKREMEILDLIASGLSNREIADKLFVSENTVKTHLSRLFDKLNAKRRTQLVQLAKEQRLIR